MIVDASSGVGVDESGPHIILGAVPPTVPGEREVMGDTSGDTEQDELRKKQSY